MTLPLVATIAFVFENRCTRALTFSHVPARWQSDNKSDDSKQLYELHSYMNNANTVSPLARFVCSSVWKFVVSEGSLFAHVHSSSQPSDQNPAKVVLPALFIIPESLGATAVRGHCACT